MKNEWLASILGENVELTPEMDKAISSYIAKGFVSKTDFNEKTEKLKGALEDIAARDAQLSELSKLGDNSAALQKRVDELQKENQRALATATLEQQNAAMARAILKAGARNETAVRAMLDTEKIKFDNGKLTGLEEQLETLQKSDPWAFSNSGMSSRLQGEGTPDASAGEDPNAFMNDLFRGKLQGE